MVVFENDTKYDENVKKLVEFILRHALAGDLFSVSGFYSNVASNDTYAIIRLRINVKPCYDECEIIERKAMVKKIIDSNTDLRESIRTDLNRFLDILYHSLNYGAHYYENVDDDELDNVVLDDLDELDDVVIDDLDD